jgi:hypothetical protein
MPIADVSLAEGAGELDDVHEPGRRRKLFGNCDGRLDGLFDDHGDEWRSVPARGDHDRRVRQQQRRSADRERGADTSGRRW